MLDGNLQAASHHGAPFGADGVRGRVGCEPMTVQTVRRLGMATAIRLRSGQRRPLAIVGRDTRLSGDILEPALIAGLAAAGMDVVRVGMLPTPAIAMLTRSMWADLGVMISASHNPHDDNRIKLFGPDGYQLSDIVETQIKAMVGQEMSCVAPAKLGRTRSVTDAADRYVEAVKATFPRLARLEGMRIVVDCAHGAAHRIAPAVLHELGAEVVAIDVAPNGTNINERHDVMHPETLRHAVAEHRADAGIALDGDADRVIMCDERGQMVDGDQMLALIATEWRCAGQLRGEGVVGTVMSNVGLEQYLRRHGLDLLRSGVGDRYVLEMMLETGCNVGGEQSGHVLLTDHATTGDGLIAALQVLAAVQEAERPMSEVARVFEPTPQRTRTMRMSDGGAGPILLGRNDVQTAIKTARDRLGRFGRVLVRNSGTEPAIRIMAECEDITLVEAVIGDVWAALSQAHQTVSLAGD